ncbi:hypothetical protein [Streptomyces sp. NBC_00582]|uniref:hypothetical protein n=1 Tax=Streptomyces sp. NBC_00582 TaxID=2975783 RepID=UPI002E7FC37A|nr:hypothetical protein [Streptomyces sp. NBC_00582]WUB60448.1 hypothetical protein OG852_08650 [Streptomyces sp. NBC_00582]
MSDALDKAEAAAREAAADTDVVRIVAAVLAAQQAAQQQPPATVAQQATAPFDSRKWLTIGGLGIAGGLVASLFAVAVAIGAVSVAILALVLRGLWADFQKGR